MSSPDESEQTDAIGALRSEIRRLRRQLAELRSERELLTFVLDSLPDYASYVDKDLIYRACNAIYASESGRPLETFVGKHVVEFLGEAGLAAIGPHVERVLQGEPVVYEGRVDYRFKSQQDVEVRYTPHRAADGELRGFSVYVRNITAQRRAEETLRQQALHDPLTNLPNRVLFAERLVQGIARAERNRKRLAVYFVDLDGFKFVNDSLGHEVGDRVLRDVATVLGEAVRRNDTLARVGGDEFVLMVEDLDEKRQATKVAEKVIGSVSNLTTPELNGVRIGASVGISFYPDHGQDPKDLLIKADEAMYEAKRLGRGIYCVFGTDATELGRA